MGPGHVRWVLLGFLGGVAACVSGTATDLTDPPVGETDDTDTDTSPRPTLDDRIGQVLVGLDPPVTALERLEPADAAQVALGRQLFYDPVLSGNMDVACATCHDPAHGTTDGLPLALGTGSVGRGPRRAEGTHPPWGARRSPPLWGRGRLSSLFWDGRVQRTSEGLVTVVPLPAGDGELSLLAAQALHPLMDPAEMRGRPGDLAVDGTENEVALGDVADAYGALEDRLRAIDGYEARLVELDPDWSLRTVVEAIAAYQRSRFDVTDSRWDNYLRGDVDALSDEEKLGATFFFADGRCVTCHAGPALTDGRFHNIGVRPIGPADRGREAVSGSEADLYAMRTPPLRNVALARGPYFHNGSVGDLEGVVVHYSDPESRRAATDHLPPDLMPNTDPGVDAALDQALSEDLPLFDSGMTTAGLSNIRVFLGSLNDAEASERALEDVPAEVPSGLPVGGWPR